MPSPKLEPLVLSAREWQVLQGWARRRATAQALALRARVVLACSAGASNTAVAAQLGVSRPVVIKWRSRFLAARLEGLRDEPRPGAPRTVTDEQVELVITRALQERGPGQGTHWSTRSMAAATGMSQSSISRIWRASGLKPHLVQGWKLSTGAQFTGKARDVAGLYLDPPEKALVLCVDEKSQIQAPGRTAPCLPLLSAAPARRTDDCVRTGVASLFAALEATSGPVIAQHHRRHRQQEFLRFLRLIDAAVPTGLDLHLICDNYATDKTPEVQRWLLRHPRFHLHFTPASSLWINLAERWFAELASRELRRPAHNSVDDLEAGLGTWISAPNQNPRPFAWTRTAGEIPPPPPPTVSQSATQDTSGRAC